MSVERLDPEVSSPEEAFRQKRDSVIPLAGSLLMPNSLFFREEVSSQVEGPIGATVENLRALRMLETWVRMELKYMELEAFKDEPWEVRYASESDKTGALRKRFTTREEAIDYANESDGSAVFGYYKAVQRKLPLDPEDLPLALQQFPSKSSLTNELAE